MQKYKKTLNFFAKPIAGLVILFLLFPPVHEITPAAQASVTCVSRAYSATEQSNSANFVTYSSRDTCPIGYQLAGNSLAQIPLNNGSGGLLNALQNTSADPRNQTAINNVSGANDIGCLSGAGSVGNTIALCLTNVIYVVTVGIGSAFAYVSGIFFNFAVALSLNSFSYALQFINGGWTVARDIANLFFILILVFIAFTIMLNAETAGTMRTLVGVIFIALIINFSFFITRVVIDVSNIFAVQFYNAIEADPLSKSLASATTASGQVGSIAATSIGLAKSDAKDLTQSIMNALQIQNIFGNQSFQKMVQQNSGGLTTFITLTFIYVAAAILLWMLTIAFIVNGIKFLMRIVVLWLVIIASPLAFIASTLPQTKSWFNQWRDVLVSYSIYPIVFMFIFLILTVVLKQLGTCPPVGSTAPVSATGCLMGDMFTSISALNSGGVSPNFFVWLGAMIANIAIRLGFVIALLYIGMKVADSIGLMGAEFAQNIGNKIGNGGLLRAYNVAWKRGPGALVGAVDRSMAKGVLSKVGGNSNLGYELRRYITKPLAGSTIPGSHGESAIERHERITKESKEQGENREARKAFVEGKDAKKSNDEDVKWMQANQTEYNAAKKKDAASRTGPEQDLVSAGDRAKSRIKNFKEGDFDRMELKDIKSLITVINADQLKALQNSKKLKAADKADLKNTWEKENADSAFRKANKEIAEIRKIGTALGSLHVDLSDIDRHIGGIGSTARAGVHINEKLVADMKTTAKKQFARLDSDIALDARKNIDTTAKRDSRDKMRELIEHIDKLDTERKNTPIDTGGAKESGTFINV